MLPYPSFLNATQPKLPTDLITKRNVYGKLERISDVSANQPMRSMSRSQQCSPWLHTKRITAIFRWRLQTSFPMTCHGFRWTCLRMAGRFAYKPTKTGYLLYSVGNDGKDDGGTPICDPTRGARYGVFDFEGVRYSSRCESLQRLPI